MAGGWFIPPGGARELTRGLAGRDMLAGVWFVPPGAGCDVGVLEGDAAVRSGHKQVRIKERIIEIKANVNQRIRNITSCRLKKITE